MQSRFAHIVGVAAAYGVLNQLWLWSANTAAISSAVRPGLKVFWLIIAVSIYVITAGRVARHSDTHWIGPTGRFAGLAILLGMLFIILPSIWWYRGAFFHDSSFGERWTELLGISAAVALLGAAGAVVIGGLARYFPQQVPPEPPRSGMNSRPSGMRRDPD